MTTQPQPQTETPERCPNCDAQPIGDYLSCGKLCRDFDCGSTWSGVARGMRKPTVMCRRNEKQNLERRLRALEAERDDLARWKRQALEVANQLQEQEIGREIGVGLGQHISPAILPWIREQKKKLKAMETAAEGMERALSITNGWLLTGCQLEPPYNVESVRAAVQQALAAYRAIKSPEKT